MRTISLDPYPRELLLVESREEFQRTYRRLTGKREYKVPPDAFGMTTLLYPPRGKHKYLVWLNRRKPDEAAHELSHVALDLFDYIRCDPREGNGEAFCYFLQHLMRVTAKK